MDLNHLLHGAYDMHIHTAPDVTPRKCDDLELAQRLQAAGMAGCAIKSHYMDTSGRAALLQKLYPELTFAGGVTLNRSLGGVNPQAVERMAQMGGKMLWFPTLEARSYQHFHHAGDGTDLSQFPTALDEDGKLLPQAVEVLEVAAQYKLVVGTGHLSAREGLALVREARRLDGLQMVLTHADNPADQYTLEQQQEAVRAGAMVEHCYFTTYYNRVSAQEIARQIQGVGPEHVILSTDFGQVKSPYSDEGMLGYMEALYACGVSEDALVQMTRTNPQRLMASLLFIPFFSYPQTRHRPRGRARRLSLFYSRTSTGPAMSSRSGWTAQSRASTCTPARAARRRASPNSGWVRSLGSIHSTSPIWTTKHTAAS